MHFGSLGSLEIEYNSSLEKPMAEVENHRQSKFKKIIFFSFDYNYVKIVFNNAEDFKTYKNR